MSTPMFKENTNHTVYRNSDNQVVPSITTIIKIINKPELVYWANSLGYRRKSVKGELDIATYVGDITHKLIESYLNTGTYSFDIIKRTGPAERIPIKYAFASFLSLYSEIRDDLKVRETELKLEGKSSGGTLDLLADFNKKVTLGDYKTSKTFYPTMFLQISGYDILLRETQDLKVDQYVVFLLDKKEGKKAKMKICDDKDEMKFYRECFKKLVEFYHEWYYINQAFWGKELIE